VGYVYTHSCLSLVYTMEGGLSPVLSSLLPTLAQRAPET
jgi:hypothetical protein